MGTTPLPSKSKPYKWYQKPGNIKHALFDFKAMADQKRGIKYNEAGKVRNELSDDTSNYSLGNRSTLTVIC